MSKDNVIDVDFNEKKVPESVPPAPESERKAEEKPSHPDPVIESVEVYNNEGVCMYTTSVEGKTNTKLLLIDGIILLLEVSDPKYHHPIESYRPTVDMAVKTIYKERVL